MHLTETNVHSLTKLSAIGEDPGLTKSQEFFSFYHPLRPNSSERDPHVASTKPSIRYITAARCSISLPQCLIGLARLTISAEKRLLSSSWSSGIGGCGAAGCSWCFSRIRLLSRMCVLTNGGSFSDSGRERRERSRPKQPKIDIVS